MGKSARNRLCTAARSHPKSDAPELLNLHGTVDHVAYPSCNKSQGPLGAIRWIRVINKGNQNCRTRANCNPPSIVMKNKTANLNPKL